MDGLELVILSITENDVKEWAGEEDWKRLKENGLVEAAMYRARKYMWWWLDGGDMWSECICEAVGEVLEGR